MNNNIDFDSVLSLVDKAISPTYLNQTQEIVLREVWNGKTYTKMAYDYNYDPEYIKTVGCNLWQTLSRAFGEQINKSNFVPFMRQRIGLLLEDKKTQLSSEVESLQNRGQEKIYSWATAPNVKHFVGRERELATLSDWSRNEDCRLIVVSGMTGAGKTTLVTKFADSIKDEFDYVIWFSLSQHPSLTKLLNKYLDIINRGRRNERSQELSFLLSELIECLRRQRILLVLDGLQSILEVSKNSIFYKQEFEGYGQFLRSIISTDHQSLLLTTSRIKPKLLQYYASSRVRFLDLQGFDRQSIVPFLNHHTNDCMVEKELLKLSKTLQYNPQLLEIAHNHLEDIADDNAEQVIEDLSLLEAISNLLEQEISYLSPLSQEIIYWLAISCNPTSLEDLSRQIKHPQSKLKFSHSLKSLTERSLVVKENQTYKLMPIMKTYLRRKLVGLALSGKADVSV